MFTARTLLLALILLASLGAAHAADSWDGPPFSTPARELLQAASAIKRERPTDVVVLLDERSFVFDAQHRRDAHQRLIYRVDSPDGVENWAASSARWQPWHQARPTIRARVITTDGREHQLDQNLLTDAGTRSDGNQVYDDDHTLEGPLPAVAIGAVVEEEITVRDEKPFFAGRDGVPRIRRPAGAGAAHAHRHRCARIAADETHHAVCCRMRRSRKRAPTAACAGRSSRVRSTRCDEMDANLPAERAGLAQRGIFFRRLLGSGGEACIAT